ncbi:Unknown protein sequence [Pseudomonas syringae pv. syringae]|nr:Unknown protein sequence [Pseudomonas syringae pv. syringae]
MGEQYFMLYVDTSKAHPQMMITQWPDSIVCILAIPLLRDRDHLGAARGEASALHAPPSGSGGGK